MRRTAAAVYEHWFALDLLVERRPLRRGDGPHPDGGAVEAVRARHVLVATGGAGQLFAVTTNPTESTGDGIAMALRAGVAVADLEFVQFHPTALHHPSMPRPLLSEALRGHGALLRDSHGERFVDELLPRDKVSRAIMAVLADQGIDHVWLDATGLDRFADRFPTIAAALREVGLDPARDWLPVAPAAHYLCGGIVADLDGATSLPGLWVAGEAACNGVHGANRLASNSLLDGMVFGPRVVEAVGAGLDGPRPTGAMRLRARRASRATTGVPGRRLPAADRGHRERRGASDVAGARDALQRTMTADAGVLRSAASLRRGRGAAAARRRRRSAEAADADELRNLATVGAALAAGALARTESRGAHARTDFPDTDAAQRVATSRAVTVGDVPDFPRIWSPATRSAGKSCRARTER